MLLHYQGNSISYLFPIPRQDRKKKKGNAHVYAKIEPYTASPKGLRQGGCVRQKKHQRRAIENIQYLNFKSSLSYLVSEDIRET